MARARRRSEMSVAEWRFEVAHVSSQNAHAESSRAPLIVEAQRSRDRRDKTYLEQAFKIYPWICARCGRDCSGEKLRELMVHHRDHNDDTIHLMGATGSCCVSTVTKTSTRGIR